MLLPVGTAQRADAAAIVQRWSSRRAGGGGGKDGNGDDGGGDGDGGGGEGAGEPGGLEAGARVQVSGLVAKPALNGCGGTQDGNQFTMPAHLEPENAKSGLLAMKGHPFDQARQGLSVVIPVGRVVAEAHGVSMVEAEQES